MSLAIEVELASNEVAGALFNCVPFFPSTNSMYYPEQFTSFYKFGRIDQRSAFALKASGLIAFQAAKKKSNFFVQMKDG